ncbi:MAG: cytidine deaminase [candidate division Zixibacteria bacterium]|nr:cytidine deaminase [candidate division Zixibacteria bacterium]
MSDVELIEAARQVQKNAYAPYSNFKIGVAILGNDSQIYTGVNVESSSYGLTICAERGAVCKAVAAGCKIFAKIVVYSSCSPPATPCGACRQVLYEFGQDLQVICVNDHNEIVRYELSQLLPEGFRLKDKQN